MKRAANAARKMNLTITTLPYAFDRDLRISRSYEQIKNKLFGRESQPGRTQWKRRPKIDPRQDPVSSSKQVQEREVRPTLICCAALVLILKIGCPEVRPRRRGIVMRTASVALGI